MVETNNISPLISKYEDQLEKDPRSRVFAPLAEAYRKVGLIENAFKVLKKGIRYNPEYLLGYLSLAQCYLDKGEYALSYNTIRPLVPLHRDNIKLQTLFALCAEKTDNKDEALDTYKYLLFLQPKNEKIAFHVTRLERELNEDAVFQKDSSPVSFEIDSLKATPEADRALDDWVQVDLSNDSEVDDQEDSWVVESAQSTNLPEPNRSPAIEVESVEIIQEVAPKEELVVEEVEATPVITHTLVDLYIEQGHREKALELLEKFLEIQPDNEETQKRLHLLKSELGTKKSEDEGRSNLMAAFDNVQSEPVAETESPNLSSAETQHESLDLAEITRPLEDFLGELKTRFQRL